MIFTTPSDENFDLVSQIFRSLEWSALGKIPMAATTSRGVFNNWNYTV